MLRKKLEMQIAKLEAGTAKLRARLKKQERAEDTRRKYLVGALVVHHLTARPDATFARKLEDALRSMLPDFPARAADKALCADLLGDMPPTKSEPTPRVEPRTETRCDAKPRCETPMPEIDYDRPLSSADERCLKRTLGCPLPEFIAKFGVDEAVRRAKAELRGAKRARSRKHYTLWSAVLARIEHSRNEDANGAKRATARSPFGPRRRRQSHEGPAAAVPAVISLASAPGASRPVIITSDPETSANAPRTAKRA